jgi:hypothetical protein
MSVSTRRKRGIELAACIYGTLLIAYPSIFRREFGAQMVQVFRTACRNSLQEGTWGLMRFWIYALVDLGASAFAERLADRRARPGQRRPYLYMGALILSLSTGYLHLRADADLLSVALLLGGAFVCSLTHPKGAPRFALILGLGIPAALLIAHGAAAPSVPHRDADLPVPAAFIPALMGAYTGVFAHRIFPRLASSLKLGRQQLY